MSARQLTIRNLEISNVTSARPVVTANTARPKTKLGMASPTSTAKIIEESNEGVVFGDRSMGVKINGVVPRREKSLVV